MRFVAREHVARGRRRVTFSLHATDKVSSHFPRSPFTHPPFRASPAFPFFSPSFCPLSFFPLPRMNFVAPNREKPAERISLFSFATLPSSKNIYDHSSLLPLFPSRTRVSNHASFHDRFQYDFINPCIC